MLPGDFGIVRSAMPLHERNMANNIFFLRYIPEYKKLTKDPYHLINIDAPLLSCFVLFFNLSLMFFL